MTLTVNLVTGASTRCSTPEIEGGPLEAYQPFPDGIVLTLGPGGGVSYTPELGLLGAEQTARFKATFALERFEQLLGVPAAT